MWIFLVGTLYYKNSNILYRGNWEYNMAHGFGEEYDNNNNLTYSGVWNYNIKIDKILQ